MDLAATKKWILYLPEKVKVEATKKQQLDNVISTAIINGKIKEINCHPSTFKTLRSLYGNLGDGELESISIAYDCPDKTFLQYMILSDDRKARNHARELGINAIDILAFFVLANNTGLLSKQKVIHYIGELAQNSYAVRDDVYKVLLKNMV
jgi:predicted nucleic acid-binding protein